MTVAHAVLFCNLTISIHMPHTWHDESLMRILVINDNFNPHATYVA